MHRLLDDDWRTKGEYASLKAPTIIQELTLQIPQWLDRGCNSPKDKVMKGRLRKRLTG